MSNTKATQMTAQQATPFSQNGHRRAVLYARVSSDDTRKDGRNLASQLEMCRTYCNDPQRKYRIVAELHEDDKGASGASFDLPQLGTILAMAERKEFEVLVVRELDRLSRNLAKQLIVEETLKRNGVTVEYVLADYADSPEGNLQKHIRATVAEYEREKIKERNVRGRRNVVKGGRIMVHGNAPYGYTIVSEKRNGKNVDVGLAINEDEARIVRMVFDWYIEGAGGSVIADRLTKMGVPTWADTHKNHITRKRGYAEWGSSFVRKIIRSEMYAGIWYYGKRAKGAEPIPLEVPAIISREQWVRAQEARRVHTVISKRNTKHEYLMQHRIKCGCGHTVRARVVKGYPYYECPSADGVTATLSCGLLHYRADFLDRIVWDWLVSWFKDPSDLRRKLEAYKAEQDTINAPILNTLKANDKLIADNQVQLVRIKAMCEAGVYTLEETVERKTRLDDTITKLKGAGTELQARLAGTLSSDDINTLIEFAYLMGDGIAEASDTFEKRRKIIELLNVRAILTIEDGQRICTASFILANGNESKRLAIPDGRKRKLSVENTGIGTFAPATRRTPSSHPARKRRWMALC